MQMWDSMPTRATREAGGRAAASGGMSMENLVLSCGGEGRREASAGTVGPSLAAVWVVAWTGMLTALAKVSSLVVVATLVVVLVFFFRRRRRRRGTREGEGERGREAEGGVHAVELVDGIAELFLEIADPAARQYGCADAALAGEAARA